MQVFEILKSLEETPGRTAKIEELKKYSEHTPFKYVMKMNFCSTIVSVIPEGEPPYRKDEQDGPSRASLWSYLKSFPIFVQSGQSDNMRAMQRERIFIEMLEAIDNDEAIAVVLAKDKNLQSKYSIDASMMQEAFPDLDIRNDDPVVEQTDEEKADELLSIAKMKEESIKTLRAEVTELKKSAKKLVAGNE